MKTGCPRAFFTSLLLISLAFPAWGQLSSSAVDDLVEDAMEKFTVAGVAVGIVKDGEIIHAKGYGLKSVETGEKVDAYTSFAIASNSKAFTSAALAILVERLCDPEFQYPGSADTPQRTGSWCG